MEHRSHSYRPRNGQFKAAQLLACFNRINAGHRSVISLSTRSMLWTLRRLRASSSAYSNRTTAAGAITRSLYSGSCIMAGSKRGTSGHISGLPHRASSPLRENSLRSASDRRANRPGGIRLADGIRLYCNMPQGKHAGRTAEPALLSGS